MTRHILDHACASTDGAELKRAADLERLSGRAGPHAATTRLQRRPAERAPDNPRMKAYLDIERALR